MECKDVACCCWYCIIVCMYICHRWWKLLGQPVHFFGPCGPRLSLAHPLLSPIKDYILRHCNVLTSTGMWNGVVCRGSVHTMRVDLFTVLQHRFTENFTFAHGLLPPTCKTVLASDIVSLDWLVVWPAHFQSLPPPILSLGHSRELCCNRWTDHDAVWDVDLGGPGGPYILPDPRVEAAIL